MITKLLFRAPDSTSEWPWECEYWSTDRRKDLPIIEHWAKDNDIPMLSYSTSFYFSSQEDLMLFMLTWG